MTDPGAQPAQPSTAPDLGPQAAARQVRLRRAPRYRSFVFTGVLIGALAATVVSRFAAPTSTFSGGSRLGYLAVVLALIGAVLGGVTAVLVERPRR